MRIYKCDICGKLIDKPDGNLSITQGFLIVLDIDLCSECLEEVERWVKENTSRRVRENESDY